MKPSLLLVAVTIYVLALASAEMMAQDGSVPSTPAESSAVVAEPSAPLTTPRALIIAGLPGDDDHVKAFSQTIASLVAGLEKSAGVAPARAVVLFGGESLADATDLRGATLVTGAGADHIRAAAAELTAVAIPDEDLWVIILGHAHFDGRYSQLNLPGPDMNQNDFAKAFAQVNCRRQAFWMLTSVSGYHLRPLAKPGRIVISATEADLEVNEPFAAEKLAARLNEFLKTPDVDSDGKLSLLDLYVGMARDVSEHYTSNKLMATEHSLIEDNADNRASELQAWYLPESLGGRRREGDAIPKLNTKQDGFFASQWVLADAPPEVKTVEPPPNNDTPPPVVEPVDDKTEKAKDDDKPVDSPEPPTAPESEPEPKSQPPIVAEPPSEATP